MFALFAYSHKICPLAVCQLLPALNNNRWHRIEMKGSNLNTSKSVSSSTRCVHITCVYTLSRSIFLSLSLSPLYLYIFIYLKPTYVLVCMSQTSKLTLENCDVQLIGKSKHLNVKIIKQWLRPNLLQQDIHTNQICSRPFNNSQECVDQIFNNPSKVCFHYI